MFNTKFIISACAKFSWWFTFIEIICKCPDAADSRETEKQIYSFKINYNKNDLNTIFEEVEYDFCGGTFIDDDTIFHSWWHGNIVNSNIWLIHS